MNAKMLGRAERCCSAGRAQAGGARVQRVAASHSQPQPSRVTAAFAPASSSVFCAGERLATSARPRRGAASARGGLQVVAVIPMLQGDASQQLPPDLPSYLFKERIVYLVRRQ